MGKVLKGTIYPSSQYVEALLITVGVAIFSLLSKSSDKDTETELLGLVFLVMYISFDSFTSQWQSRIYADYGKENVDPFQMMLGVNVSAICITTAGLILTGDFPIVFEFLSHNPEVFHYNIITAITSATGYVGYHSCRKHGMHATIRLPSFCFSWCSSLILIRSLSQLCIFMTIKGTSRMYPRQFPSLP